MNPFRPEVDIELGKKTRHLRFTTNSLVKLEVALGIKQQDLLTRIQKSAILSEIARKEATTEAEPQTERERLERVLKRLEAKKADSDTSFSTAETRALLWAGLLHEDPDLTLDEAGNLMDEAPGDSDNEREQYCCFLATWAFFLRLAPSAQSQTMMAELRRVQKELPNTLRNGTGTGSAASLSTVG